VGRKHLVSLEECEKEGFPRTLGTPNALDDRARKPEGEGEKQGAKLETSFKTTLFWTLGKSAPFDLL